MDILELCFFLIAGILISKGLILQVQGTLRKGMQKKNNKIIMGILFKISGFLVLAGVIYESKTKALFYGLASFFIAFVAVILYTLLKKKERL